MATRAKSMTTTAPLQLRDYQQECLSSLGAAARRGVKRMLVALPTGTGKTVVFSQIPSMIKGGRRMLVVAHREELLDQAAAEISRANPALTVDMEQAKLHASPWANVVVASIQTLAVSPQRLEGLVPESIAVLVVDEAHHAPATSYVKLFARLGLAPDIDALSESTKTARSRLLQEFKPGPAAPTLIGFTATPHRTDTIGLE